MGSTCLSLVPVLRCIGLTRLESGILLIPAGLELVFSLGLIVAGRGQGRYVIRFVVHCEVEHLVLTIFASRRYLLAAEGIFYMFLAVLDVLTHEISMFSSSLSSFRNLDIFIGASNQPISPLLDIVTDHGVRRHLVHTCGSVHRLPVYLQTNRILSILSTTIRLRGSHIRPRCHPHPHRYK